jgi:hypothetical protein
MQTHAENLSMSQTNTQRYQIPREIYSVSGRRQNQNETNDVISSEKFESDKDNRNLMMSFRGD